MPVWNFVRKSFYQDSVTLMRLAGEMEAVAGVRMAAAMMGTPPNRDLLRQAGLLAAEGESAGPTDLVVAVVADTQEAAVAARDAADAALARRPAAAAGAAATRPRTLESGLRALPGATLALISVPGAYAGAEALRALRAGLHVMLFSDNVPVETEIELKRLARARGLFMLGPDCGTAIINGVPLGFANAVPRGRIGVAGASGTGLQEVTSLIAAAGEGISQAIGVGGRDLSDAVGGTMMSQALEALARDPATEVVVVIGKPPGASVGRRLREQMAALDKPCVVHFAGGSPSPDADGENAERAGTAGGIPWPAATLEDAARAAVALARGARPAPVEFTVDAVEIDRLVEAAVATMRPGQRFVRGVYAGGTLAYEALDLLAAKLPGVAGGLTGQGQGHRVVDLGEDVFTVGRPHPMIEGRVRREWIDKEAREPSTAVLLLDVVLGYGAHPDPAAEILPAIEMARRESGLAGRGLAVVASVCGTDADPQHRPAQVEALRARDVIVMPSNAQAARLAALIATRLAKRPA